MDAHLDVLRTAVARAGVVLLRGFEVADSACFAAIAERIGGPLGQDYQGPSMRSTVARGVYTASEVPARLVIPEHAEMSYLPPMPRHLFFWCTRPARVGGETTLVDGRRVWQRLDRTQVAPLLDGPLQIRRRHRGPGRLHDPFELKPWSELFGTLDRDEALSRALASGYGARFERGGALTLQNTQPVLRTHPESGEQAWLNHLLVFHASAPRAILESAYRREGQLREGALSLFARGYRQLLERARLPVASDVRLASGAPVPELAVRHIREVVDREAHALVWQAGDLAIVDNHLVMHGRRPYVGERQVALAWSDARA